MFGALNPASGKHEPFHLYSMRQAIEEGFILDVLANYTTYHTFWKIEKATTEDPEYDPKKARRAIARFVSLHPYQLAQKAEIIVEHFRAHTSKEMQGQAKAMVVTRHGCTPPATSRRSTGTSPSMATTTSRTLVAFSGKLDDGTGVAADRSGHERRSRVPDRRAVRRPGVRAADRRREVPDRVRPAAAADDVRRQDTGRPGGGADALPTEPDPPAEGADVRAGLPQRAPKTIVEAFEQFHGCTVAPPTDPNILWDSRRLLDNHDVLRARGDHGGDAGAPRCRRQARRAIRRGLCRPRPEPSAVLRLGRRGAGRVPRCSDAVRADVLLRVTDRSVHRPGPGAPLRLLPGAVAVPAERRYRRAARPRDRRRADSSAPSDDLQRRARAHLGVGEVQSFFGTGTGGQQQLELETLSSIVEQLNDRFGTDFSEADQLLFDQFHADWVADDELSDQAQSNTIDNFRLAFQKKFMNTIVTRMDTNSEIFKTDPRRRRSPRSRSRLLPQEGLRGAARGCIAGERSDLPTPTVCRRASGQ